MGGNTYGSDAGSGGYSLRWLQHVPVWEADVAVLHEPWRNAGSARAMVLVMGDGDVVHEAVLPADAVRTAQDAARALEKAVHTVAAEAGGYPRRLLVRDPDTVAHLAQVLGQHGVRVRASASGEVGRTIEQLAGLLDVPDAAWDLLPLDDWDEDGVDATLAAPVFAAAARFWRARPWDRVADGETLVVRWRDRHSLVAINRPGGHGHVATLFTNPHEFYEGSHPTSGRTVLSLRFAAGRTVPQAIREQAASHGWELAAQDAYPLLLGSGPAFHEGLDAEDVRHLTLTLEAVAAWTELHRAHPSTLPFVHPDSGVELRGEYDIEPVPWPAMRRARPVGAVGPAAGAVAAGSSAERAGEAEARRVDAFAAHLRGGGTRRGLVDQYVEHASEWAGFLDRHARLSAEAVTEYDLRRFLYDWYPRHARGSEDEAERMPASLRRYFGWLQAREGIAYPWADAVLRERRAFLERMETVPLGREDDEDADSDADDGLARWRGLLFRDLDARVLLRDRGFPDPALLPWERAPSPRVAALADELQRLWLRWRDETVAAGITAPGPLRAALLARQREWERTTHPRWGMSPLRVAAEDHGGGPTEL